MKDVINILITSISRKVWLVKVFKSALKQTRVDGKVLSADITPLSAGLYASDKHYLVPPSSGRNFIPAVLKICNRENIKLLIPTRDNELLLFAKNRRKFEAQGTYVMVPNPEVIKICNDKYRFFQFLERNNIPTPRTFLPHQINFSSVKYPLLVKSRCGSGSKSVFKAKNGNELRFFINYVSDPIIQEFIKGKEYTVDLFSDFNGKVLTIVPRERIETFCGESYKGRTVKDREIIEQARNLAEKLKTIGHITIQCIKGYNGVKFIEVNPRFGGGAVLGIKSGANTPLLLLRLILGRKDKPQIGNFKQNLVMLRYTEDFFILNNKFLNTNNYDKGDYF